MPQIVFTWQPHAQPRVVVEPLTAARVHVFGCEEHMLAAWLSHMRARDPDAIAVFQVVEHHTQCSGANKRPIGLF